MRERDRALALRRPISTLVILASTMGKAPDVSERAVECRPIIAGNRWPAWSVRELVEVGTHADGSPRMGEIQVNGLHANGKKKPGAYQGFTLSPDPASLMIERAEH